LRKNWDQPIFDLFFRDKKTFLGKRGQRNLSEETEMGVVEKVRTNQFFDAKEKEKRNI
jgi:hypothetical protein